MGIGGCAIKTQPTNGMDHDRVRRQGISVSALSNFAVLRWSTGDNVMLDIEDLAVSRGIMALTGGP